MFAKVYTFELRYQLRSAVFWITAALFFLFPFGAIASDAIQIGDTANVHRNAPDHIAQIHVVGLLFYMFVITAFVANVVVRDLEHGFWPIIRTTRINRFDYLIGRFAGAVTAASIGYLAMPLGIAVGSLMPWVDPETIGGFKPEPYLFSFVVLALPGLFLLGAAFFALATVTRSMMATYLGVAAFFVLWLVGNIWARQLEMERTAALLEPFGLRAYGLATKYWTASERNELVPALKGIFLWNRVLVIGSGFAFLGLAFALFRFEERTSPAVAAARPRRRAEAAPPPSLAAPKLRPQFGLRTALSQLAARTRLDMGQVFLSPAFVILLIMGIINSVASLWSVDQLYGVDIHPVTRVMITQLNGAFTIFPIIIAIYYAGDLVWRERDRRTHEIVESTPLPDWAFVAPKTLAITLVLVATFLASVVTAMLVQGLKGYFDFELGKYLWWYVLPASVDCFQIAALAVVFQALAPHKFIGWGLMVLYIVFTIAMPGAGLEHHLYLYGTSPTVPLSDMNNQGKFWIGAAWFRLYWSAFALILLVIAFGVWRRGLDTAILPRLRRLPLRLRGTPSLVLSLALLVFVCSGCFIYLNTNIWNPYRSQRDEDRWLADYERTLIKFETVPQPKIVDVRLDVDIRPHEPRIDTRGIYVIQNKTSEPLREIHVRFPRDLVMRSLSIQGARPRTTFDQFNYRIFVFDTPMAPGEARKMAFETVLTQRGFKNERDQRRVVDNGAFVSDGEITPQLGMDRGGLLQDRRKRAKYHLPRELRMPKLGTPGADQFNYGGHDADWVTSDIRVTTDADQVPMAPGDVVYDRISGGRRSAEFRTTSPILRFFSIQSARYAVHESNDQGILISVFHHPPHDWNTQRMDAGARAALAYFQANYSPYQFHHIRFLEFPDYGQFAQAFAGTVPWSEGLGFITDLPSRGDKIDYVTYVGAHEIAHQWWAHQVVGADEQGSTALSETLAQYSALMVMKHMYGPDMIRRFLKYELDRYLRARGGDVLPEQPLMKVENQPYIHYRKGSLVMYRLQDEIGEDAVNRALRRLIAKYAFKGPPYPTTLDLVAAIRAEAPADKQALITDLFANITLYDIQTQRAVVKKRPDGRWDVTLTVSARKLYADGHGRETASPMNETLDVGLFTAEPGKSGFDPAKVIQMQRMQIHSGVQTLSLIAPRAPRWAGVDPYNKLIDRNADDNTLKVGG